MFKIMFKNIYEKYLKTNYSRNVSNFYLFQKSLKMFKKITKF